MTEPDADGRATRPDVRAAIARHPWRTALAVAALAIVALLLLWDWNWFKGSLERQVQARTGRALAIGGDLDVDLGRITVVRADDLRFANAPWSKQPDMAAAKRLELRVETWPLLHGEMRIAGLRLLQPRLLLETGPKGAGNWDFGAPGGATPRIQRLRIEDGKLRFLDAPGDTDIQVKLQSAAPRKSDAAPPVALSGGGTWAGNRFTLEGSAESPLDLQDAEKPYRIDLRARAGATRAHARGVLLNPFQFEGFDLQFALAGSNLDDLFPLIGIALPPSPPYAFDGRLRHTGNHWRYDGFSGKVGDSDLSGSASIATGGPRPLLRAKLVSRRLDFDDLAGFIGGAPQAGGGESSNPELAAQAAKQAASPRLLPDTPYNLQKLRAMDADVTLKAQRINAPALPLDDMDAHLKLDDGLLRLDPLNFGVAGGDIRSTVRMDAREKLIRTRADVTARGLNLGKLFPHVEITQDAIGKIGGRIQLAGKGNSIAAMLGSADGSVALGMGKGKISHLLVELAGLDIYQSLQYLIGKDEQIPIRCAFGDFGVEHGLMTAHALAFDTTDTIFIGEGSINLRDETLDLTLKPRPKDRSLLALRTPLVIGGTFKDPSFRPDMGKLGLRGAIALTLGSIAPPAALLATIDLGGGKDADCGGKYAL